MVKDQFFFIGEKILFEIFAYDRLTRGNFLIADIIFYFKNKNLLGVIEMVKDCELKKYRIKK